MLNWFRTEFSSIRKADQEEESDSPLTRNDWLLAVLLFAVLGALSLFGAQKIDRVLYQHVEGRDVWFDGDIDRIFIVETSRSSVHAERNSLHPLYSILTYPPVWILRTAANLDPINAVRTFHAAIAGIWIASFFLLLRLIRCGVGDALLFTAVAGTSASAIIWFVVPESFPLGSLSILPSLALSALPLRRFKAIPFAIAGAFSLSVTLSNFMFAVFAAVLRWPWKKAALVLLSSVLIVLALTVGQKVIFPKSKFPLESLGQEKKFILPVHSGGPVHIAQSFLFHTMVMPKIETRDNRRMAGWDRTTLQKSCLGSGGPWGMVATFAWAGLFTIGIYGLFSSSRFLVFRMVLIAGMAGQLLLHLFYGYETFLFSLHFLPLLVAIAALGTKTRFRPLVLALAVVFSLSALINNVGQRNLAYDHVRLYHTLPPPPPPSKH